ncbi:type I secretion system permease/ATPase [Shinella zoogloeoides]|uniref:type I secretion system permease/ATPase n=1 Tax=Shinella zoogloeoides TaxID=352475 RepID=UPI001FE1D5AF|nr:type I secretion system permease/ATPase [Shinella zoogloeoides]
MAAETAGIVHPAPEPASIGGETFRTAFQRVAVFLGRPGSEVVLFSGVPFDEAMPSLEDVQRLSDRVGLDVRAFGWRDLAAGNFDLPAIILFNDGSAVSLLEIHGAGNTSYVEAMRSQLQGHLPARESIRAVLAFSTVSADTMKSAIEGRDGTIVRQHWLVSALVPFWRSYAQVAVAALFINLLALTSPLFTMNVYDRILPNDAKATLWVLALGVSGAILFDLVLKTARSALIDYAGRRADLKLSYLLFEKVLNASMSARPMQTGEYASRITQYEFVREFFTSNTISVLIDTVFVFVFLIVIYLVSGWIVIVPAGAFLLALAIGLIAQHRIGRRVAAATNESSMKQSLLVETISTIETVKSLKAERNLLRKWHELSKKAALTSEEIKQLSSSAANWTQFVSQLVSVVIILAGAYQFSQGKMSSGAIIAAVMLSGRAVAPMGQIAMTLARLRQALLSLRILNSIMEMPEDLPGATGFVNRDIAKGGFAFNQVEFSYPGSDQKVLNGLTFTVRPGERVGVIGRIGSGKTTIGRLLGALYPPTGGSLMIDGIDIRQYHPAVVRTAVAVASQSADLFSGSVKENLLMANPEASDADIIEVARRTGVDEFVSRHPRGYDMPVGERGGNLSGGQRQAVAIARLLLAQPKIIFLDEPSGAMDLASERRLITNLSTAFGPETTIVISTHRYSMLELVDRLIVLEAGRVIADGPKGAVIEELQKKAGRPS